MADLQQSLQTLVELRTYYLQKLTFHSTEAERAQTQLSLTEQMILEIISLTSNEKSNPNSEQASSSQPTSNREVEAKEHIPPPPKPKPPAATKNSKRSSKTQKLQVVPEFRHLSKQESLREIFQREPGNILTISYIARVLYGEVDGELKAKAHARVSGTLHAAKHKGWWKAVPDQFGCYISG